MANEFIDFFRYSGITYLLLNEKWQKSERNVKKLKNGDPLVDELPNEYINKIATFANIWQSGFLGGLAKTFEVLVGDHFDIDGKKESRKGILDLLIFPLIGRFLMWAGFWLIKQSVQVGPAIMMCFLIGISCEVLRFSLGAALTLLLSPIVFIVVTAVNALAYKDEQTILNFEFSDLNRSNESRTSIRDALNDPPVYVSCWGLGESGVHRIHKIKSNDSNNEPTNLSKFGIILDNDNEREFSLDSNKEGDKAVLGALERLGISQ